MFTKKIKKQVRIFGRPFEVRAEIVSIGSYSAHADYKEMLQYLSCQKPEKVKKVFLVHGELDTQEKYRERLNEAGFADVVIPEQGTLENLE